MPVVGLTVGVVLWGGITCRAARDVIGLIEGTLDLTNTLDAFETIDLASRHEWF